MKRTQSDKLSAKREEFLGFILLAENLMALRMERFLSQSPLSDLQTPASVARQAYAVALTLPGRYAPAGEGVLRLDSTVATGI